MANVRTKTVKTWGQLQQSIAPMLPGEPERIPWTWFDTVGYVSGTTTQLDFFQAVQTDRVLGNMQAAGQIPAPMYFDLHHLGVYFDLPVSGVTDPAPAAAVATGTLNDLVNLVEGSLSLQIAQKEYFSTKISACPGGVGPSGALALGGSDVAATSSNYIQQGTNGIPDLRNRNNFWGDLTLPHNQNFLVRLNWTAAVTLYAAGTYPIVVFLDGYLYRRVL
jgi:hypothetical protein